jgi:uncharacterized membrane protein YjfL (UPF0719 family)
MAPTRAAGAAGAAGTGVAFMAGTAQTKVIKVQAMPPYATWAMERFVCSLLVFIVLWLMTKCWRTARTNQRIALGDADVSVKRSGFASVWHQTAKSFERQLLIPGRANR